MSETALVISPKVEITVGGRSLQEIPDEALIERTFQDSADRIILRADAIEIIGNQRVYEMAAGVLSDATKFIKERERAEKQECEPYKSAIERIRMATDRLLTPITAAKMRLQPLIDRFAQEERRKVEDEKRRQEAEVARIKAEAQKLEDERIWLEQQRQRKEREELERQERERKELAAKAERERLAAETEQARLKAEREEAERRGTAAQMEAARKAEADSKAKAEAEELARTKAQKEAEEKAAAEKAKADAALLQQQQELSLRQAELNRSAADATKIITAPKVEGMAVITKWTFRIIGETPAEQKASMIKALAVHPEWFEIKPSARIIEKAAKDVNGRLECEGIQFYQETKARST
jgi:hypothetical protein